MEFIRLWEEILNAVTGYDFEAMLIFDETEESESALSYDNELIKGYSEAAAFEETKGKKERLIEESMIYEDIPHITPGRYRGDEDEAFFGTLSAKKANGEWWISESAEGMLRAAEGRDIEELYEQMSSSFEEALNALENQRAAFIGEIKESAAYAVSFYDTEKERGAAAKDFWGNDFIDTNMSVGLRALFERTAADAGLFTNERLKSELSERQENAEEKNEFKLTRERARAIIEQGIADGELKRENVRIEVINREERKGERDVEDTIELLTGRLCEMMAKGADGFYL